LKIRSAKGGGRSGRRVKSFQNEGIKSPFKRDENARSVCGLSLKRCGLD
jgi:hypothetical protein